MKSLIFTLLFMALLSGLTACSSVDRQAVPEDAHASAEIPGIPNARFWGDRPPENLQELVEEADRQRAAAGTDKDLVYLAISGGGDDGAYGAGVLNGWSELGTRPEFTIVTGVSTGALTAPFAFLGSDYDPVLQEVYGGLPTDQLFSERDVFGILSEASIADSSPLAQVIAHYATPKMLAEVAKEHRRGRRLLVQSTNLDAQRPVIWNLGAIAASDAPNALQIFRQALLASASMPAIFQPMLFEVEVDGERYQEMHVDGGVISEDTVLLGWRLDKLEQAASRQVTYYVLRNGHAAPEYKEIDYGIVSIGGRALSIMIKMIGDLNLITAYELAKARGAEFYATWIGSDFEHDYPGPFDPAYMQALYQYGYQHVLKGTAWRTSLDTW